MKTKLYPTILREIAKLIEARRVKEVNIEALEEILKYIKEKQKGYKVLKRGSPLAFVGLLSLRETKGEEIPEDRMKILEEAFKEEHLDVGAMVEIEGEIYLCMPVGWKRVK